MGRNRAGRCEGEDHLGPLPGPVPVFVRHGENPVLGQPGVVRAHEKYLQCIRLWTIVHGNADDSRQTRCQKSTALACESGKTNEDDFGK